MAQTELQKTISTNIRSIRTRLGMTQTEAAKKAGLSIGYLNKVEKGSGNLTISNLENIAEALNTSVIDLIGSKIPKEFKLTKTEIKAAEQTMKTLTAVITHLSD